MAMALLVAEEGAGDPVVGPQAAEQLAELGITRVSLLADRSGVGVLLEGWAFDPARVPEAVGVMFPDGAEVRTLHAVGQVAVEVPSEGRRIG